MLKDRRQSAYAHFASLLASADSLAAELNIQRSIPRKGKRQVHRSNHDVASLEDFYKVSASIPLLDEVIKDLEIRFTANDFGVVDELRKLIPKMVVALEKSEVDNMVFSISSIIHRAPGAGKYSIRMRSFFGRRSGLAEKIRLPTF